MSIEDSKESISVQDTPVSCRASSRFDFTINQLKFAKQEPKICNPDDNLQIDPSNGDDSVKSCIMRQAKPL